jgi:hypothetical protein
MDRNKQEKNPGNSSEGEESESEDSDQGSLVLTEVMEKDDAVSAARQTLDIDFEVLLKLAAQGKAAEDGLARAERALEIRRKDEAQRVENFRAITHAAIEAKIRDPDAIERREGSKFRRTLMSIVSTSALASVGATIYVAIKGGTIAAFGGLLSLSILSLVMVAVMANGGQLSVRNLTEVIRALMGAQADNKGGSKIKSATRNRGKKP